jgi:signal transduction histidine kinase
MVDEEHEGEDLEHRTLAHDLLQSVAIIQAIVTATRLTTPTPEQLDANLAMVEAEAQAMARLCQRQLDGARPVGPVDLGALAAAVVSRMQPVYEGEIDCEVQPGVRLQVVDDPLDWERSLLNVLENACRAAGRGGKISISCRRHQHLIHLSVGDSGPGFGEAPAGRSSLGMVGVSRLVDRHGGHLELKRSALGGAQVTIVVPARD